MMAEKASKHTISDLHQMQSMSLNDKIRMTKRRIQEWVDEYGVDGVYVSFSGGKDSTVLLTIAREMYPDMKAVFVDTGLEYPEIRQFVKTFPNVDWVKPKMNFRQVIEQYGYPFISKEVSECVYGARKYLTSIMEMANAPDRQTDRQTDLPYRYWYDRVTGTGLYQKPHREQTKKRGSASKTGKADGDADGRRSDKGECP